jgi:hypothetical protein
MSEGYLNEVRGVAKTGEKQLFLRFYGHSFFPGKTICRIHR